MSEHARDEMNPAIGPDVDIPGPYPTGEAPTSDEAAESSSHEHAHTNVTRDAHSLGDLTKERSTSTTAAETGGLGSPRYDEEKTEHK